jgi:glycosyltransferase involved in cell wall biosynthesis
LKKILIITYYWPPSGGAGVQRWLKFVKYMRDFGWEPVVYTALDGEMPVKDDSLAKDVPSGITVIKKPIWEPYSIYKKFTGRKKDDRINASFLSESKEPGLGEKISIWIRGNFFIPDARKFWIRPSARFLNDYIKKENISYVISTGPPHSMHLIALKLKERNPELKWIADFRDPWTNIDFYEKLRLTGWADRRHKMLEQIVLSKADLVLSIGKAMNDELVEIYSSADGNDPNKFRVITNGYDDDDVSRTPVQKDGKFSIAHIGTLVKDRNPDSLWNVLARLVKMNKSFRESLEIKLVGKVDFFVNEQIRQKGLSKYVRKIEYMPHDEVIIEQQRSRVLLLLVNNTKNAAGILTGKFFEYMASGAPILAIGPTNGDLAKILTETNSGLISDFKDEQTLEKNLLALFHGQTISRNETKINTYSRKELTRKLCAILDVL